MGAILGMTLALTLVICNTGNLFGMVASGVAPASTLAVFVGALTAMFGVGAALTGMIFIELERQ
jgi:hypothetical protein